MRAIGSSQNPKFKRWKALLESKGIQKYKSVLVMGRKIVPEILVQFPSKVSEILYCEDSGISLSVPGKSIDSFQLPSRLFKEIDIFGTQFPILVTEMPELEQINLSESPHGMEVLCATSDPGNLGGLLRSAEAFAAQRIVVLKEGAFPFHPKVVRASSGSSLRLAWSRSGAVVRGPSIHEVPPSVFALDLEGFDISQHQFPRDLRLLVGEEGQGLPESLKGCTRLAIPMASSVESLNALAAGSIALFAYRRQFPLE